MSDKIDTGNGTAPEDGLPDDPQQRVQWTYAAEDAAALGERYDQWAKIYDEDLSDVHGYVAPGLAVEMFARHVPKDALILDAGAGTGLVGALLAHEGYGRIMAVDYSEGMLEKAEAKGVYQSVAQADLNEELAFDDNSVDAVICVGTLSYVKSKVLSEFVRITKPGGVVVYTAKTETHVSHGFQGLENQLSDFMKWKPLERSDEFLPMPNTYPDLVYRLFAWEVR